MAEKVILTDKYKKPYMPITRGELVLDSSGNPAFTSEAFLATPRHHGLLSATDKKKIDDITNTSYTLSGGLIENNYQVVLKSNDVNTSQATISSMVGASIITDENNNEVIKAGSAGLVPAPTDINTFLKGDGTWSVIKPTTSSKSKNVTDKGWYRIAISKSSILRCLGTFEIEGSVSGKHTVTTVLSGINYGENPFITVLNTSHYTSAAITKVRIVYHTTYTNNYAYLEIYKDTTTSTSLTIKLADGYGWSLCDITIGSVPTGYSYKEIPLDNATLSTTGRIITNGIKSTTGEFTGNIYSSAIYNGSKIYATKQEIIHADSNYFELNKGYPSSIMWFNASEYKFKIGSNILFMIASNGNVGIGNVGGAPAYKLHVGGGEVMADTYHAWSGGFKKNGSSDSYVLLGGGGHKAISDFLTSLPSHTHDYLPLSGGTMTSTANISWTDRGAWGNASATYPYSYGGLSWSGTSDWIKIYAKEAGSDALNLVFDFGDDSGHYITFRDNGTEYTMLHSGNIGSQAVNYATSAPAAVNWGGTGSTTKIKIKINSTTSWMLSFVVTIYQGYRSSKVMVSGYNYGSSYWHDPEAVLLGDSNGETSITVYFGYDSAWNLWVGFDGGIYTGVSISDVTNGYTQISSLKDLFTISNVSSLSTILKTVTATNSVNYASSAGSIGGFTIANFMTYADHPSYVSASFTDENLSKKAGEKYIEYWDGAGGWFNSAWGQVTANYGFVGNLTGTASYATYAGNADTVDGYHASSLWRSDGATWNPTANITMTPTSNGQEWSFDFRSKGSYTGSHWHVWDESKNTLLRVDADSGAVSAPYGFVGNLSGNATYANSAGSASYAHYLPTKYDGGQQTNPQKYFNNDIGLRVAMTGMSSKGTSYWSDTLWINGYSGGDVQQMCALHFNRDGTPRAFISAQSNQSTSYGTFYELITGYNIGSQSVNYANSAGTASKVTCTEASGDTPRPIVGIVNSLLYYTSKVTIRWDNGNVTAPTFTGRLIGSADKVNGYTIWTGTQALYNAATKNNNTIYLIY